MSVIPIILLTAAVSADCFVMAAALGSMKIRLSRECSLIITLISTLILCLSIALSDIIRCILPDNLMRFIGAAILFLYGAFSCISECMKKSDAQECAARELSTHCALTTALALSCDTAVTGVLCDLSAAAIPIVAVTSVLMHSAAISFGSFLGLTVFSNKRRRMGWLPGVLLIFLAISILI